MSKIESGTLSVPDSYTKALAAQGHRAWQAANDAIKKECPEQANLELTIQFHD